MTKSIVSLQLDAAQVRAGRALLAWSQQDLARTAKVGTSTVADFERGQRSPNQESTDLIRVAFEGAGIEFTAGGVTFSCAQRMKPVIGGKPIRWIEASDLNDWANRRAGQDGMPELLSRLIRAACGPEAKIRFPSGDSVQFSGWDGQCVVANGWGPIPDGGSGWEIGCQNNAIRKKAEKDYQDRVKDAQGLKPSETTFVFVTPRRWPGKTKWASERRADGFWRDVKAIDGDDLVHWIELFPAVGHWLSVALEKRPQGITELSELWTQWSRATKIPLTADLILRGRDEDAAKIMNWLRSPPSALTVHAESVEEAIAFLHAAISELPTDYRQAYFSRALVPSDEAGSLALGDASTPLILVLRNAPEGFPQSAALRGHHVFVAFGPEPSVATNALTLTRQRRDHIEQALEDMSVDRVDAHNLARDSGRSLIVLRRLMQPAPGRLPKWSEAPPRALIAALFAGGWNENVDGDKCAIEALSGLAYAEVTRELAPLVAAVDGPLRKSGNAWKVASPRDAWLLLAKYVTQADIDRYLKIFAEVLGEEDPRYELNSHDRSLAGWRGIGLARSELLRFGLTETLILLSLWGNYAPTIVDPVALADGAVTKLLKNAKAKLWWSLQSDFQRLAEASPNAFLDALRKGLRASPSPLASLFVGDDSGIFGQEYLSNLLWGLERVAWSEDHLPHVAEVLAGLAAMDPGGRYSNRPSNSLRHIFLLWNPQTHATLSERLKVLDGLRKRWPDQAWALLLAIVPKSHDTATPTAHPQWRDFGVGRSEIVTYDLIAIGAKAIADRLSQDVGRSANRWCKLLDVYSNFGSDIRIAIGKRLLATVPLISDSDGKKMIWEALRRMLHHHRQFPNADWSVPENELSDFQISYDLLAPDDFVEANSWLFSPGATPARPATGGWEAEAANRDHLQLEVVAGITDRDGREGVLRLAKAALQAQWVGQKVMMVEETKPFRDELLRIGLQSQGKEWELAHGMLVTAASSKDSDSTSRLLALAKKEFWGEGAITRILLAAPACREVWSQAADAGPSVENAYWSSAPIWGLQGGVVDDLVFATEQLLRIGRAREAVRFIGSHLKGGIPEDLIIRALREAVNENADQTDDHNDATMFAHYVGEILDHLSTKPEVLRSDMVSLEWAYYQALRDSPHPPRMLEQALATEPKFFLDVLRAAYIPSKESGIVEPEPGDPEKANAIASQAWSLLREWTWVPGADADGVVDAASLQEWIYSARSLALSCGRLEVCDSRIGAVFAAARADADGCWPPIPIRDAIEELRSADLENGVCSGVVNHRGITVRLPTDGGAQERALASRYRKDSKSIANEWPQTAALLERIAKSFDADSKREDQQVEVREWM